MKKIMILLAVFSSYVATSQEICNNAIDDDADGFVDLNDSECTCEDLADTTNLIYNPSFESMDCCPSAENQLYCTSGWEKFNSATPDYYNSCGLVTLGFDIPEPSYPIPDGNGWVGLAMSGGGAYGWEEQFGQILETDLEAGTEYTFSFYASWCKDLTTVDLELYCSPASDDYLNPLVTCLSGSDEWEFMAGETITFLDNEWYQFEWTFTPEVDMRAISLGFDCFSGVWDLSYIYIDKLSLTGGGIGAQVLSEGDFCNNDLMLTAEIDTVGGSWQWYREGIALLGETSDELNPMLYGIGSYSAVYTIGDNCYRVDYETEIEGTVTADFVLEDGCQFEALIFENTSSMDDGIEPDWAWNFGDGFVSTDLDPLHDYATPGVFNVRLIASADNACPDTVVKEIEIFPSPEAYFEFFVGGVSSEDGATVTCLTQSVDFYDDSFIEAPAEIIEWNWDFGDGSSSSDVDPSHIFSTEGTFNVLLEVVSNDGCVGTHALTIIATDTLAVEVLFIQPTCYGFADGIISIDVSEEIVDVIYEIRDSEGDLRNVDNNNSAYDLETGWYYLTVSDATECPRIDSVFLPQPEELVITYTTEDELFGLDGVIDIEVTGGTPDYVYDWDYDGTGDFDDPEDLLMAVGGENIIVVKDNNGCELAEIITLESQLSLQKNALQNITIYPNPTSDKITIAANGFFEYQLLDAAGKIVLKSYGYDQIELSLKNFENGVYTVYVFNENLSSIVKIIKI